MTLHGFTHLALRVDDLRQAEGVYADLFDLKVAFREVGNADEWWTLPPSSTWDDAGVNAERGLVMLHRGGIRLALEGVQSICREGSLSHVGLHADARDLRRIRGRAVALGCRIVVDREAALI